MHSREIVVDLFAAIPQLMYLTGVEASKKEIKKGVTLAKVAEPELAEKATEHHINKAINKLNKKFPSKVQK